jgi:hypothetical protein
MTIMFPKEGRSERGKMSKEESAFIDRAIEFGCLLTYVKFGIAGTPAEWHHARTGTGGGCRSVHTRGFALAPRFHRNSNEGLHVMGRKAWERHFGVTELDLVDLSHRMFEAGV